MIFFLDFDGVLVDSIDECFQVSFKTYYENIFFEHQIKEYKDLFYKNRGLVKPPYEYYILHKSIETFLNDEQKSVEQIFIKSLDLISEKEKEDFENLFFKNRKLLMEQDFDSWASMNPLTPFGRKLVKKDNSNIYIVTAKNLEATSALLKYYEINNIAAIYSNKDVKDAQTKGNLINDLMIEKNFDNAIFIDDACEHLDSVKNSKVQCFFANWGYGKNNNKHRIYNINNF